jgi:transposase
LVASLTSCFAASGDGGMSLPAEWSGLETCRTLSFFPNPAPVRRVEVFTGPGRRRRWTADQKAQIIAESCAGGETVSAVARWHRLTPQQLFGWRRAAQQHAEGEVGENGVGIHARGRRGVLVALGCADCDGLAGGSPKIEIVMGAATVRVPPRLDTVTLATVLCAVRAAA